jgi:NAD(P)-dependent dehydrogenase (short-subunit alcohol dehydrogenase family)
MHKEWSVVLGVSSGVGAAIARSLLRDPGLNLFGVHRGNHPEEAAALERAAAEVERRAAFRVADGATYEGAFQGAEEVLEVVGRRSVRMLVHSMASGSVAHLAGPKPVHPKQIAKTFEVMAHSFVYWTQALLHYELLAPGARLLGLTNPCCESILHNTGIISAAKGALEVYVRHLAFELGPRGYRVNLLKFGAVETTALRHIFKGDAWQHMEAVHARMIPAGRMCTVDDVGRFVSVLAGDAAGWFNGATIDFTGGQAQSTYNAMMFPDYRPDTTEP